MQFTCSAPALHPHPTGLGAGSPSAPRSPETLKDLTLLWWLLMRRSKKLLILAELRERQEQHYTQPEPAQPSLHCSSRDCPWAGEQGTGSLLWHLGPEGAPHPSRTPYSCVPRVQASGRIFPKPLREERAAPACREVPGMFSNFTM